MNNQDVNNQPLAEQDTDFLQQKDYWEQVAYWRSKDYWTQFTEMLDDLEDMLEGYLEDMLDE